MNITNDSITSQFNRLSIASPAQPVYSQKMLRAAVKIRSLLREVKRLNDHFENLVATEADIYLIRRVGLKCVEKISKICIIVAKFPFLASNLIEPMKVLNKRIITYVR